MGVIINEFEMVVEESPEAPSSPSAPAEDMGLTPELSPMDIVFIIDHEEERQLRIFAH